MATAEEYMQELIRQREELGTRAQSALDATRDPLPELSGGEALYAAGLGLLPALVGAAFKGKRGANIGAEAGAAGVESFGNLYSAKAEADRAANSALAQTLLSQQTSLQNDITQAALQSSREIADRENLLLEALSPKGSALGVKDQPLDDVRVEELREIAKDLDPEITEEELEEKYPYGMSYRQAQESKDYLKTKMKLEERAASEKGRYYEFPRGVSERQKKRFEKEYDVFVPYLASLHKFEQVLADSRSSPERIRAAIIEVIDTMPERAKAGAALTDLELQIVTLALSPDYKNNPLSAVNSFVRDSLAGLSPSREGQLRLVKELKTIRTARLTGVADAMGVNMKPLFFSTPSGREFMLGERAQVRDQESKDVYEYRIDGQSEDGEPLATRIRRVYGERR